MSPEGFHITHWKDELSLAQSVQTQGQGLSVFCAGVCAGGRADDHCSWAQSMNSPEQNYFNFVQSGFRNAFPVVLLLQLPPKLTEV